MIIRDFTVDELAPVTSLDIAEHAFQMTEEAFRGFYEQTARPVWIYLARTTGDPRLADDLMQEAFYRLLRARVDFETDEHRRHYLFRIATNLVRDHRRRPSLETATDLTPEPASPNAADRATTHIDVTRAMERLKPRERSLLWLAYAQGCSHEEIAEVLGVKTASLKALLHRARRRLAGFLGGDETLARRTNPGGRS
jgi:RNA polymerase sigma-70 factor (ECF subfamily)